MPRLLIILLSIIYATTVFAGDIRLVADNAVEYHQKEQKLIAKGNAKASKDDMSIEADTLIGYYNPKTKNKITKVEAYQNVKLHSPDANAFGNKMIYNIKTDTAVLSGTPATIKTADTTITSTGPITYYQTQQKAIAKDNVIATDSKGNRVHADLMTAWFSKSSSDQLTLDKIDIEQNLKIISQDTVVTALKGTYYAKEGKIKLFDDVVINQKGNILKGTSAETDLNTGISKILSGGKTGRVKGIFKEKKKDK